jgi:hypothetical protein
MIVGNSLHIYKKSPERKVGGQVLFKEEPLMALDLSKVSLKHNSDR